MRKITHIAVGLLLFSLQFKGEWWPAFVVGMSAFLPDIDWVIRQPPPGWGILFKSRGPHRTLLHNIWALIIFGLLIKSWIPYTLPLFIIGYLSHLILDSLTPTGIYWAWPIGDLKFMKRWFFINGPLSTGSIWDMMIYVLSMTGGAVVLSKKIHAPIWATFLVLAFILEALQRVIKAWGF